MVAKKGFGVLDYVLFAGILLVSIGIGVFYAIRGRKASTSDFLVARRKVSLIPISLSIFASFMSAITIIGMPAEIFANGTRYFMYVFGISIGCFLTTLTFVPLLHPMKFISSFEYIEQRFNSRAAKTCGALILSLFQVLYVGTASLAPSTALEAVTGFPIWATILLTIGVATIYTFLGGIRAVVWTDALQTVVMVGGIVAVIVKGVLDVGGMDVVWNINYDWGRINFINLSPDPSARHSIWALLIGGAFSFYGVYGANQASIQRYCALPSIREARLSLLLNIPLLFIMFITVGLTGIVIFAFYVQKGCDPVSGKDVTSTNQILPWFVVEVLDYPGVPGLFLSSIFSGALSSISSSLAALAAVGLEDFVKPVFGKRLKESHTIIISKLLVLISGGIGVTIAFLLQNLGGTILQVSLTFTTSAIAPILGIFLLAAAFPVANWIGTICGAIIGLILPMWLGVGQYFTQLPRATLDMPTSMCNVTTITSNITTVASSIRELVGIEHMYTLSYMWFPMIGTLTTILVGVVVSLLTGGWKQETSKRHLFTFLRRWFGTSSDEEDVMEMKRDEY